MNKIKKLNPMMRKTEVLIPTGILMVFLMSGCFSPKGLQYFTEYTEGIDSFRTAAPKTLALRPGDQVYITITSFDQNDNALLSSQENELRVNSPQAMYLIGYAVNDSGYINYPMVGKVMVQGLTLQQTEDLFEEKLKGYLNLPAVSIRFIDKTITVLGEVNAPGQYVYSKDQLSIFQALGMAGDLTLSGDRKEIIIFRQDRDVLRKETINLKNESVLLSEYYYMRPNDIIYVKPTSSARFRIASTTYTLILTTITTLILVFDYSNR
jgi:polysaccharide export outer membrane protein